MTAIGEWTFGDITFAVVREGYVLPLPGRGKRKTIRFAIGGNWVIQWGKGFGPYRVTLPIYVDGSTREDFEGAVDVAATLAGPDGESFSNMLLDIADDPQWKMLINDPGIRLVTLSWIEKGL